MPILQPLTCSQQKIALAASHFSTLFAPSAPRESAPPSPPALLLSLADSFLPYSATPPPMTSHERSRELASTARQVGVLFAKLSSVLQEWATDVETAGNVATSSPLSNHSAHPAFVSNPTHQPQLTQHYVPDPPPPSMHKQHHHLNPVSAPLPPTAAAVASAAFAASVAGVPTHPQCLSEALPHSLPQTHAPPQLHELTPTQSPPAPPLGYVPVHVPHPEEIDTDEFSGKRRRLQTLGRDSIPRSSEGPRPKRTRVDWTEAENVVLFSTLEKYSHLPENDLLHEVVKALGGSRTMFQTRGRFRNLLANGRIRTSNTVPKRWVVVPGRSGRRVRVNWKSEENQILFHTVQRCKHMEEDDLIQEIVKELKGRRTWFQTKGHFRNLLTSGKIRPSDTIPPYWIIAEEILDRHSDDMPSMDMPDKDDEADDGDTVPSAF